MKKRKEKNKMKSLSYQKKFFSYLTDYQKPSLLMELMKEQILFLYS